MLKQQKFGVEIEMTGLTREKAAQTVAEALNSTSNHLGGGYDEYSIRDNQNRGWKIVSDGSIRPQRKVNGTWQECGDSTRKVELVSPPLQYGDIETVQSIVRALRKNGAKVNDSCGIHIHVDASNHNPKSLRNLMNIVASKQDLLYKALQIKSNRLNYTRKLDGGMIQRVNTIKPTTMDRMAYAWYGTDSTSERGRHYHSSRYHGLNLHNVWFRGTVEFRFFNSTLHAGEVKAYIQLSLAVSAQAIAQRSANPKATESTNEKYTFRTWLLRLGLIGDEFETARLHLLKNLDGNSAWRFPVAN